MSERIHIPPYEYFAAVQHAWAITAVRQTHKREYMPQFGNTEFDAYMMSSISETAVCEYLGVKHPRIVVLEGDGGSDLVVDGVRLQIKSCQPTHRYFISNNTKTFSADFGILTRFVMPTVVDIVGFVTREELESSGEIRDFGYGLRLAMREDSLSPINGLRERYGKGLQERVPGVPRETGANQGAFAAQRSTARVRTGSRQVAF